MKVTKSTAESYVITEVKSLDPVTVYVTNYQPGKGKIVIECFGKSWSHFWGGMGGKRLQEFFLTANNDYILDKLLDNIYETDFDSINKKAKELDVYLHVESDIEIVMNKEEMIACFGDDWRSDLPTRTTSDYRYVSRIVDAIKDAFKTELDQTITISFDK